MMTSSTTLAFILFLVLACLQVLATENPRTADPVGKTARICKPYPEGDTLGERSTCPFTVTKDNDFKRVPPIVYHFSCNCPTSRCSDSGDYRCVQVRKQLEVAFKGFSTRVTVLQKKVMQVNASCVCATSKTQGPVVLVGRTRVGKYGNKTVPQHVEAVTKIHANESVDEFEKL